ncbi:MAG: hypothetical protein ACXWJ6_13875 [Xanthobacteraceae bacterium]
MYPCVKAKMRRIAALVLVSASTALAGCSDIYYDRRETVSSGAADAVASNMAVQTIDPWPPNVANQNIAMNGDRAVLAAERYRANRVLWSNGSNTSSAGYTQPAQQQQPAMNSSTSGSSGTQVK